MQEIVDQRPERPMGQEPIRPVDLEVGIVADVLLPEVVPGLVDEPQLGDRQDR